jgi:hypothetical protein
LARPQACEEYASNAIVALKEAGILQPLQPSDSNKTLTRNERENRRPW